MKIKIFRAFMCLTIICSLLLAGCSGNSNNSKVETGTAKESDNTTPQVTEAAKDVNDSTPTPNEEDNNLIETSSGKYSVLVTDEKGIPLEGVMVQFCSDEMCTAEKTGMNGVAEFTAEEGIYEVHILRAPDGYVKDETVYNTEATYSLLTIALKQ